MRMEDYRIANLEAWNRLVYTDEKSISRRILERVHLMPVRVKGTRNYPSSKACRKRFQGYIIKALKERTATKHLGVGHVGYIEEMGLMN